MQMAPSLRELVAAPRLVAACLLAIGVGGHARAQAIPPQMRYSTHDHTAFGGGETPDLREWCVDAKSPGDGLTYTASTIEVQEARSTSLYSGASVRVPAGASEFILTGAARRQIAILQIVDAAQVIQSQTYFFGETTAFGEPDLSRATNARGISVWPTSVDLTTRVAMCGETFDKKLPLPQAAAAAGWPGSTGGNCSGFIAVFDGGGQLKWSHHLFGGATNQNSIVTDVSIRTEMIGAVLTDVVTYCGISGHGNPALNGTMNALAAFAAPAASAGCPPTAGGSTDNGAGNWDGFVGRIARPTGGGATTTVFHAVVGGEMQDGLFGLAELDAHRFVAVGSTGIAGTVGSSGKTFPVIMGPWPGPICLSGTSVVYAMGASLVFDSSTAATGAITLESTRLYGGGLFTASGVPVALAPTQTVLRDVAVHPDMVAGLPRMTVVGSTNDPNLFTSIQMMSPSPQATIGGGSDGFLATFFVNAATADQGPIIGTFRGTSLSEFLTGVGGWNEFSDHLHVTGRVFQVGTPTTAAIPSQMDVGSYFHDNSNGAPLQPTMVDLQSALVGGSSEDHPTAIGVANGTSAFGDFGIGDPAGGGIAVDERGRVTVVGTTASANYPVLAGRSKVGSVNDAIRSVFDMLPNGSGRTDGTHSFIGAPPVALPVPAFFGGTTPECALGAFGRRIGMPPPALPRMLIDLEIPGVAGGVPTAGSPIALIVDRPPNLQSPAGLSGWQVDFPTSGPGPLALPEGVGAGPACFQPACVPALSVDSPGRHLGDRVCAVVLCLARAGVWRLVALLWRTIVACCEPGLVVCLLGVAPNAIDPEPIR